MRRVPWWSVLSSAAAPVLLIGGWSVAAGLQRGGFDPSVQTISALAARGAADRWVMTSALAGLGVCHLVTALGLRPAAPTGRIMLGAGGAATLLVAAFPLPRSGASAAHTVAATAAFVLLAAWPAPAARWRRDPLPAPPWGLRPAVAVTAAAGLLGLVGWFGATLSGHGPTGLVERVAAGAQALWPLAVVLSCRRGTAST